MRVEPIIFNKFALSLGKQFSGLSMNKLLRWLPILAIIVLAAGLFGWQRLQAYLVANPQSPIANLDERLVDMRRLDNGLQVYLISDRQAPIASWQWQGPAARGVAALAERPYGGSTVAQFTTSLGGQWQAFSGMQETQIHASGKDYGALMAMLASLAADPVVQHPVDWRGEAIRNQRVFSQEAVLVLTSALPIRDMLAQLPASLSSLPPAQANASVELGLTRSTPELEVAARLSIPAPGIGKQPVAQALQTLARYSHAPANWHVEADWLHFDFNDASRLSVGVQWYLALAEQWPNFARFQNNIGCYSALADRLTRLGGTGAMQACLVAEPGMNWQGDQLAIAQRALVAEEVVTPAQQFEQITPLAPIWPANPLPLVVKSFAQDDVLTSNLYRPQLGLIYQDQMWQQWHRQSNSPVSQLFIAWQLQADDLASAQLMAAAINAPQSVNQQLARRHVLASAELVNSQLQVRLVGPGQELKGALTSWLLWLAEIDRQYDQAQAQLQHTPVRFLQLQPVIEQAQALAANDWLASLQPWLFSRPMLAMHDGPLDRQSVSDLMQTLRSQIEGGEAEAASMRWRLDEPSFLLTRGTDRFQLNLPRQNYGEAAQQLMLLEWLDVALRDYGLAQSPQLSTQVEQWQDVLRVSIAADTDPGLLELHWRRFISRLAEQIKAIDSQQFDAWRLGLADSVAWLPESPVALAMQDWQAVSRGYVHLDERLRHKSAITSMSQDRFVRWLESLAQSDQAALWHHQYSGQFGSYNESEFARDRRQISDPFELLVWDAEAKLSPSLLVRD